MPSGSNHVDGTYGRNGGYMQSRIGGLYLAEIEYDHVTNIPFGW